MTGKRSSVEGRSEEPAACRNLKPSAEVAAKMAPLAKASFHDLLRRAARPSRRRASKAKETVNCPDLSGCISTNIRPSNSANTSAKPDGTHHLCDPSLD